jgi:hypothetical protein
MFSMKNGYFAFPILNILVPQEGQVPLVAGLLFFMVTSCGDFISFLARHLTQYASIFGAPPFWVSQ